MVFGSSALHDFKPALAELRCDARKQARHLNAVRSLGTRRYEASSHRAHAKIDRPDGHFFIDRSGGLAEPPTPSCTGRNASTAALAMTWALS